MHGIKIIYICALICIMLSACTSGHGVFVNETVGDDTDKTYEPEMSGSTGDSEDIASSASDEKIAVYVCGAVVNSGVYYLDVSSIKLDAVNAAGGFADGAAQYYVNLAEHVLDGERLYVPYEDEIDMGYEPLSASPQGDGRVDINSASKEVLMTLPGIGESKANAIIEYREQHGGFGSIEEIKSIRGIKEGVYDNIKDLIVVN